jgi:transcriptional regulator with XRE-family HTH domain
MYWVRYRTASELMEEDKIDTPSHRLQLLMRFLLKGVEALPQEFRLLPLPDRAQSSQQQMAQDVGVSQPTLSGWKTGKKKIFPKDEYRLAQYCQTSPERLQAYLSGEILLSQLWEEESTVASATDAYQQVLELLPLLQDHERVEVMSRCLRQSLQETQLLTISVNDTHPISLSWLIFKELLKPKRQWSQSLVPLLVMAQVSELSIEQLVWVLLGRASSVAVLRGLAQILTKDLGGATPWQLEELEEIARREESGDSPGFNLSEADRIDRAWLNWEDCHPLTIGKLIDVEAQNRPGGLVHLSQDIQIDPERLLELQQGAYPSVPELCDLAQGLQKEPGVYWSEDELRRLRISEFGNGPRPTSNGEPNGSNGEGHPVKR